MDEALAEAEVVALCNRCLVLAGLSTAVKSADEVGADNLMCSAPQKPPIGTQGIFTDTLMLFCRLSWPVPAPPCY